MSGEEENGKNGLNPVEKFEKSFQAVLSVITKEDHLSNLDHDEVRVDTEFAISELMEKARGLEAYFLKKRLHISHLLPELVLKDDINELKNELARKDKLLKKNSEKIVQWQNILSDVQSAPNINNQSGGAVLNQSGGSTQNIVQSAAPSIQNINSQSGGGGNPGSQFVLYSQIRPGLTVSIPKNFLNSTQISRFNSVVKTEPNPSTKQLPKRRTKRGKK